MRRLNSPLWLDGADTDYPPVNGAVGVDVVVIGAGITARRPRTAQTGGQVVALLESAASVTVPPATRLRSSRSATASSTGN